MGRRVDLRQLVPDDDDRDIIVMPDGKEFLLPRLGVKEMSRMLLMEEGLSRKETFENLGKMNDTLVAILRRENPGKNKVPDYDMTVQEIMSCIAAFSGAGSVAEAVRAAIAGSGDENEVAPTEDEALEAVRQLAEGAGLRDGTEEPPLGSRKPSQKRSSRSGTSARGRRSGGTTAAGKSSQRTSSKRATSKRA